MPPLETSYRRQKAVLWEASGLDRQGHHKIIAPVELKVRWINKRVEAIDPQGNVIALDALVVVAQEIPIGSIMWEGELEDWYGVGSAGSGLNLMEVVLLKRTEDLKGRFIRRTMGLRKFRDTLPTMDS